MVIEQLSDCVNIENRDKNLPSVNILQTLSIEY